MEVGEGKKKENSVIDVKVKKASVDDSLEFCSICQEEKYNMVKINCDHYFCKGCIMEYLKLSRQCPNCKQEIKIMYENNVENKVENNVEN